MRNVWLILRREYLVRVRTKAFVLFTVLLPLLMGSAVLLPTKLAIHTSSTRRVAIVTSDAKLGAAVRGELEEMRMSEEDDAARKLKNSPSTGQKADKPAFVVRVEDQPCDALKEQLSGELRDNKLDGFLWIAPDAMTSRKAVYYSRNGSDFVEANQVSRGLRIALSEEQLSARGVQTAEAKKLLGPVDVDTVKVDKSGSNKSNGMGAFFLPFALLMMIYVTVLTYGLYVMRSVIEEKSSRVVEVLLGSVTPFELMAGKILGVAAVGLTQISIWMLAAAAMGAGAMAMVGDLMKDAHLEPAVKFLFPVYFLLGYLTYACLYAAIGAIVNSDEEAQQLQFPVTIPLIACMVVATSVIRDPNTQMAFWFSMFPLTSPIIMFVRATVSMPPMWQIVVSITLSLVTLYGLVWLTSRIYRVGILMYGKRPTLPEILKWIRYT
jgi:ABC-2 type transport system permease protein